MHPSSALQASSLPQRCLAAALLSCLPCCTSDCSFFCTNYDVGSPRTLVAHLEDAQGNPVPARSATLEQENQALGCVIEDSAPSVGCNDTVEGPGTLRVEAEGQLVTREVRVGLTTKESCNSTQDVGLRLAGPGCPKPKGTAIAGRLLDRMGNEVTGGTVIASLYGRERKCSVTGARFECESMSPYGAMYTLSARFGVSQVERDVFVAAQACAVEPVDATVNLAESQCGPLDPNEVAVSLVVTVPAGEFAIARILAEGRSALCTPIPQTPVTRNRFECPALTATGGGAYRVEVSVGTTSKSKLVNVIDDGCRPSFEMVSFAF